MKSTDSTAFMLLTIRKSLIDKDGVIVDFGEHLRPSIPETRNIIDRYIK